MTRSNRKTTALAVAIAAAIVAAPFAYSAGKPGAGAKRGAPIDVSKVAGQDAFDGFIISYHKAGRASAAAHAQSIDRAGRALGLKIATRSELGTGARLIATDRKLDRADAKRLALELMRDPSVRAVEPNGRFQRAFVPNDPQYAQQWHYKDGPGGINLEPAWDNATGDGIVVAVLDTGSTPHAEFAGQTVPGYDFISDIDTAVDGDGRDDDPNDEGDWHDGECNLFGIPEDSSWHGTHVAGTIAAATNNNAGVAGVAFDAKVQHVRALGKCGGTFADVADAIIWASGAPVPNVPANANPAEVINMSLGGGGTCAAVVQDAIDIANARGSIVVVAAGNSGGNVAGFQPASCDGVITVAATGPTGTLAGYSNFGALVSVAAPGGTSAAPPSDNVLSTLNAGLTTQGADAYAWYAGTSMASPHVAGVVALMQSVADTPLTFDEAKEILENTAYEANGAVSNCTTARLCGAGIIDAELAVDVARGAADLPPAPPPPPPPPPPIELQNGVTVTGISVGEGEDRNYVLDVPAGATNLVFTMEGGTGDADIYVQFGETPTATLWQCRPYSTGNDEVCTFPTPTAGEWFVRINGYEAATGVSLTGEYEGGSGGAAPTDLAHGIIFPLKQHRTRVPLSWEGGSSQVDIVFDGEVEATVANIGRFTHTFNLVGTGTVTYQICNAGTTSCTAEIEVDYTSRR